MKVVGRRLRWAGNLQRMSGERLTERAWETEEGGKKRRGRLILKGQR